MIEAVVSQSYHINLLSCSIHAKPDICGSAEVTWQKEREGGVGGVAECMYLTE